MDIGSDIHMEPLHKRADLLDASIRLLNTQWPRSKVARLYSLEKSCDGLPYSLVMVHSNGGPTAYPSPVIGYCRLARVISALDSVLIESVVVPEALRGRGLGRRVMELAEVHAKLKGFPTVYLNTKDKQDFYAHLGYSFCQPVNTLNAQMLETCDCSPAECNALEEDTRDCSDIATGNMAVLPGPAEIPAKGGDDRSDKQSSHLPHGVKDCRAPVDPLGEPTDKGSGLDSDTAPTLAPPPPPPAPPPPPPVHGAKTPQTVIYWMKKEIA